MKIEVVKKSPWIFGIELWHFLGELRFDIGFWCWHIYVYLWE